MKKHLLLGITIVAVSLALPVVTVAAVGLMPTFPMYFPGCKNIDWEYFQEGKNSVAYNSEITYSFLSISGKIARTGSYRENNQAFAHNIPEIFLSNDIDRPKRYANGPPLYNRFYRSVFHNMSSLEERIRSMTWHIAMEFP